MGRVVAFSEFYLPGFAGGGTIVSLSRIVSQETEHEFRVITNDHDLGSAEAFPGTSRRGWFQVGRASVAYLRPGFGDIGWAISELRSWKPDIYYVNSLQCPKFSLLPFLLRRIRLIPQARLLVAPRGECGEAAQAHKSWKKRAARPLIRWLVGKDVIWQASSTAEAGDIERWYGRALPETQRVLIRADPPPEPAATCSSGSGEDIPVIVFASRIDQMKGLDTAFGVLGDLQGPCVFRVYGVVSDEGYWIECQKLAEKLPWNVRFEYMGPYVPEQTAAILSSADAMLMPTKGENFGHAIAEALSVGCPIVISRNTIWTDVASNGGGCAGGVSESTDYLMSLLRMQPAERMALRDGVLAAYVRWHGRQAVEGSFLNGVLR